MANELGKLIGTIKHNFSITSHDGTAIKHPMTLTFDFSSCTDVQIGNWLASDRCISFCRPNRSLSLTELDNVNNTTVLAQNAGVKTKPRAERITEYVATGLPENLAIIAVDNPTRFQQIMSTVDASDDNDDDETSNE